MSAPEHSNPSAVAAPIGAYSHVAKVVAGSDIFYLAGQVGMRPDGSVPPGFGEQVEEAYANIARLLHANGLTPHNLVKLNIYVAHGNDRMAMRDPRLKHLGDVRPAATFIFVPQLADPKYLIEIEGVACR